MKKAIAPTAKDIKEHFKNAKTIQCLDDNDEYILDFSEEIDVTPSCIWLLNQVDKPYSGSNTMCMLWNKKYGYAEILTYKYACGIEPEPEFVITKDQIKTLNEIAETIEAYHLQDYLKEWFTDAFKEDKVELEVGKWYKKGNTLALIKCIDDKGMYFQRFHCYGFNLLTGYDNSCFDVAHGEYHGFELATPEEVTEALTKEAVKRGYKEGVYMEDLYHDSKDHFKCNGNSFDYEEVPFNVLKGKMALRDKAGNVIFCYGKWASIIPTITKEDAEKLIGKKIV